MVSTEMCRATLASSEHMAIGSSLPRPTKTLLGASAWRASARWEWLVALALPALVFSLVQSATGNIIGIDGYYHIKVAWLIREHGPRIAFPWLRFTILNEASYTDHHLLFHILQAPFTLLDLRLAAKVSAVVFATLGFWGCYLMMAASRVRWPFAWLALLLAVAHTFVWRHSMARPQSLALLLMVGVLWVMFERPASGRRWLLPLGFVSAWLFDGFILTLALPAAALVARLLLERRLDWRPLVYLALGTALGLLVHPYFPRDVVFAALHLFPKSGLGGGEQVSVGSEWSPYSPSGFFHRVGPALAVMIFGLIPTLAQLWRRERPDFPSVTLILLALGFLALQVRSQRIIEYFPAFAVLLAAWSWSAGGLVLLGPGSPHRLLADLARWRSWLLGLGAVLLAGWLYWTVQLARDDAASQPAAARIDTYREAAGWLADISPPGSLVFNTDWDDFPQLFFYDSHNVYVFGLDPTYMSIYNLELYRLWRSISSGGVPTPSVPLRERFGAQYVFSDTLHRPFLATAAEDPGLEEVFRSPGAVVFRVR